MESNFNNALDTISLDADVFGIKFQYLDQNDGALIEAIHTKYSKIECEGNVIGAGLPRYIGEFVQRKRSHSRIALMYNIVWVTVGVLLPLVPWYATTQSDKGVRITDLWSLAGFAVIWYALVFQRSVRDWLRYAKFPKWSRLEQ